ncbi:MAG TPA: cytochrome P450 [Micromonosporaceae bacterium]|nr:cytochrome P450 [Micromonosporaceae bacterium]
MTQTHATPPPLPTVRTCPFDPPEELTALGGTRPVTRLRYADGSVGWLVTGHPEAQAVLSDPRFSARKELQRLPVQWLGHMERVPAGPGEFIFMDPPEHTRFRKLLAGQFTMRRMRQLMPRIEEIAEEHLDAMQRQGPPVDMMRAYAYPIPSLAICELVGMPYAEAGALHDKVTMMFRFESTPDEVRRAGAGIHRTLHDLLRRKRAAPAEDLMSDLATAGELSVEEILRVVSLLLIGGFDNTANMIGLGVYALLSHPEQLARLRARPELVESAVEELMRYVPSLHIGPIRAALADVEVGGELVRAGEVVTLSLAAVNRDPRRFDEPEHLDVTRPASRHLAFGYGVHQCIGQQLARIEMRVAYTALLRRFPTLRLAVPAEEVPMRENIVPYGPRCLPIAWGAES